MHLGTHIGLLDVSIEPIAHSLPFSFLCFPVPICRFTGLAGGEEHTFWDMYLPFILFAQVM